MIRTIEATINDTGQVRLAEPATIRCFHRALVAVLDEPPAEAFETAVLSDLDWPTGLVPRRMKRGRT